jgi:hypothetical protein
MLVLKAETPEVDFGIRSGCIPGVRVIASGLSVAHPCGLFHILGCILPAFPYQDLG